MTRYLTCQAINNPDIKRNNAVLSFPRNRNVSTFRPVELHPMLLEFHCIKLNCTLFICLTTEITLSVSDFPHPHKTKPRGRNEMAPPLCGSTAMSHHEFTIREPREPQEASPMKPEMRVLGIDLAKRVFHAVGMDERG